MSKRTFDECYPEISAIIEKKRRDWQFKASVMEDFDDIKSEIEAHVWKKWELYDQSRPLGGWVATILKHQFANILRDTYTSTSSPCSRCICNTGGSSCSVYGEQSVECPLFKKWYNTKRHAHNARLPLALEHHTNEANSKPEIIFDLERAIGSLHAKIKARLTRSEWDIYDRLYLRNMSEIDTAKDLGFKTTEEGRSVGYKRIRQVKTTIIKMARQILKEDGVEDI